MAGAFRAIGTNHNTINPFGLKWKKNRRYKRMIRVLRRHDTVDDWPWNRIEVVQAIVDRLDHLPPIRFILTTRAPDAWIKSHRNFSVQSGKRHELPENKGLDDNEFIQKYLLDHNDSMRSIVPPHLLLEGNVADEKFLEEVRMFTGYPIESIPWMNKTSVRVY